MSNSLIFLKLSSPTEAKHLKDFTFKSHLSFKISLATWNHVPSPLVKTSPLSCTINPLNHVYYEIFFLYCLLWTLRLRVSYLLVIIPNQPQDLSFFLLHLSKPQSLTMEEWDGSVKDPVLGFLNFIFLITDYNFSILCLPQYCDYDLVENFHSCEVILYNLGRRFREVDYYTAATVFSFIHI